MSYSHGELVQLAEEGRRKLMDDLISRQAAIDALDRIGSLDTEADKKYARSVFEALPSAQPKRKKGKWILSDEQRQEDVDNGNYRFICSECGEGDLHSKAVTVPFCWNCGADMREKANDNQN